MDSHLIQGLKGGRREKMCFLFTNDLTRGLGCDIVVNMSCKICGRGSCTESFHSFQAQEDWEERERMSDNVDDLRVEIGNLRSTIKDLKEELKKEKIVSAAQEVIDRWKTPNWKNSLATAKLIYKLEEAISHKSE